MKAIDKETAKIVRAILTAGRTVIDNSRGMYPPVHVEASRWRKGFRIISLSLRNVYGDGREYITELLLLHKRYTEEYIPFGYRNGFTGIETYEDYSRGLTSKQKAKDYSESAARRAVTAQTRPPISVDFSKATAASLIRDYEVGRKA